jgi:hypothetical protein
MGEPTSFGIRDVFRGLPPALKRYSKLHIQPQLGDRRHDVKSPLKNRIGRAIRALALVQPSLRLLQPLCWEIGSFAIAATWPGAKPNLVRRPLSGAAVAVIMQVVCRGKHTGQRSSRPGRQ